MTLFHDYPRGGLPPSAVVWTWRIYAGTALALLAFFVSLIPVLVTPHVSDDVLNYSSRWLSQAELSKGVIAQIEYWALSTGRVFILSTYLKEAVFQIFESSQSYKAFLVAMNLACALSLVMYIWTLSANITIAIGALLTLPVLIQLRDYHDPIVSFNGLFQLSAGLIVITLTLHICYLQTGRRSWLHACLAAFVFNLFLYEMALVTVPLIWLQDWTFRRFVDWKYGASKVLSIAFAAYCSLVVAARLLGAMAFAMPESIYGLSLSPHLVVETLGKQLLAVVPFSFWILRPNDGNWGVHALPGYVPWLGSWRFFVSAPFFLLLSVVSLRMACIGGSSGGSAQSGFAVGDDPWRRSGVRSLQLASVSLIVLPALVISVISRYQGTFAPGNGYSPVYIQELGSALAISLIVAYAIDRAPRFRSSIIILFSTIVGIASAGNLVNNFAVAEKLREAWAPQYSWGAMLTSPEFRDVCWDVGTVVRDPGPWAHSEVFRHAGFRLVDPSKDGVSGNPPLAGPVEACFARTINVSGRTVTAFARLQTAPNGADYELLSRVYVVAPLEDGEERRELHVGVGCVPDRHGADVVSIREFAGRRFGTFVLEEGAASIPKGKMGLLFPCEAEARN